MPRLDDLLSEADCRALVVLARSARDPYLAPFVGPTRLGPAILVAPVGRPSRLGFLSTIDREEAALSGLPLLTPEDLDIPRWIRDGGSYDSVMAGVISRALLLCEVTPGRLAVTGTGSIGRAHALCERLQSDGWQLVPGADLVELWRKRKSPAQLAEIRRATAGIAAAMRRIAEMLAAAAVRDGKLWLDGEALTVGRLRREVATCLAERQLEQPEGNILAPAAEGAVPHNRGTDTRILHPHESLIVDFFPRGRLYTDCTRTFCVGEPPEPLARAHAEVKSVLERSRRRAVRGARCADLQQAACEDFSAAGYATLADGLMTTRGYVHNLGHGLGYEVHELPNFRPHVSAAEGELEVGDVFTLEPGLYDPEAGWAVRLEDLHHLAEDGLEILTDLPYDLDPRAW